MTKRNKRLVITFFIIIQVILAKPFLYHGIGFRLTNSGQSGFYELSTNINRLSQIYSKIGFHIEKTHYEIDYYGQMSGYNKDNDILFPINVGFRNIMFDSKLHGSLRPFYFGEIGKIGIFNNNTLELGTNEWSLGFGLQFRSGRFLHRILYGYHSNSMVDGNAMFGIILGIK